MSPKARESSLLRTVDFFGMRRPFSRRYPVLSLIAMFYRVLAIGVLVAGSAWLLFGLLSVEFALVRLIGVGKWAIACVGLLVVAEVIQLLIDIEENTRMSWAARAFGSEEPSR
ncbi:MAG TPA: hypothetical protein VNB06_05540 [Thermoanaerobaculia bacterium]|nr:hypothetical protein [Thermoanaerobaculia bacterium]